jgi:hypothetical protein
MRIVSARKPMREYQPVTEADLARARHDTGFRQKLLVENLDLLLVELGRLRTDPALIDKARALQMREGAQLAVRLADLLHALAPDGDGTDRRS